MSLRELRLAIGQLVAQVLKRVYSRGPGKVSVHIVHNVVVVHALHFHPEIDALLPEDGVAEVHAAVADRLMSAVSEALEEAEIPFRVNQWCFDVSIEEGRHALVAVCDREIEAELVAQERWERFVAAVKGRLGRFHNGRLAGDSGTLQIRRERRG